MFSMQDLANKDSFRMQARHGFTLVEMLVSVTLVLLMMTLFAQIFQMATNSVTKQRGIAENDQRARTLTTIIRRDFQKRTMRYPMPFYPGEDASTSPTSFSNRQGYIYLSTNDPSTGLDDGIQFTVSSTMLIEDQDDTPYFGRADVLVDRLNKTGMSAARTGLAISPNQPEIDDSSLIPNQTSSSSAAEVSYFVRNGNLYRRVVLLRQPLPMAGLDLGPQPTSRTGYDFFSGQPDPGNNGTYDGKFQNTSAGLTNDFLLHYDFVAVPSGLATGRQFARFLGIGALNNDPSSLVSDALANPTNRFGFNFLTGVSREHLSAATPIFFGRYLHAETSSSNFNWPQNVSVPEGDAENTLPLPQLNGGSGNPYDLVGQTLSMNPKNGLISEFDSSTSGEGSGGPRRVEDLLLSNVIEMRIELWDERLQRFAPPGHNESTPSGANGDYHSSRRLNPNYGPWGTLENTSLFRFNRTFDTFHPQAAVDLNGDSTPDVTPSPPFIAYRFYPPLQNFSSPGPSPSSMQTTDVISYWTPGTYNVGDYVFAPVTFDGDNMGMGPEIFEWDQDTIPPQAFQTAYRCIAVNDANNNQTGTEGETGPVAPPFRGQPGRIIPDNELTWESVDNRRPLQAVRMTVRFRDIPTDSVRQLSLILPTLDAPN
jgi:prepilin-type N-terminal cleavage/methylation domain-containing protein